MKTSIRMKLIILAGIILAGNVFIGFAVYISNKKRIESEQLVKKSEKIISNLSNIHLLGKDIESASRGFIITNDSSFLDPLFTAEKIIFNNIGQLRQQFQNNAIQTQRVDSIHYYMQKRLAFSLHQAELRSNQGLAAAIAFASTNQGLHYSDNLRQIITAIEQHEDTNLKQLQQANMYSVTAFNWISRIMVVLISLITILLLIVTGKNLQQNEKREKKAAELVVANKELAYQNKEKENRAAELIVANKELVFQNKEKEKRAAELIIARDKAEESDRLKSAFLANMSHEIRTPMNGILGFSELLKEPKLTGELQQEYIEIIEKSGARMMNIISDIMSISKIESGHMGISISGMNINEQMKELIAFFKPEAEQKGLQIFIKNKQPSEETIVKTDQDKVHAVLTNLIKNAIKFTDKGSIEFGVIRRDKACDCRDKACLVSTPTTTADSVSEPVELEFYVKDTGIGIAPEKLEMIFERFRQGNETLNKKYEGAGLGLSISKAFVDMLGGKIWIENNAEPAVNGSSHETKGITAFFTIPFYT